MTNYKHKINRRWPFVIREFDTDNRLEPPIRTYKEQGTKKSTETQ